VRYLRKKRSTARTERIDSRPSAATERTAKGTAENGSTMTRSRAPHGIFAGRDGAAGRYVPGEPRSRTSECASDLHAAINDGLPGSGRPSAHGAPSPDTACPQEKLGGQRRTSPQVRRPSGQVFDANTREAEDHSLTLAQNPKPPSGLGHARTDVLSSNRASTVRVRILANRCRAGQGPGSDG